MARLSEASAEVVAAGLGPMPFSATSVAAALLRGRSRAACDLDYVSLRLLTAACCPNPRLQPCLETRGTPKLTVHTSLVACSTEAIVGVLRVAVQSARPIVCIVLSGG